MTVRSDKIIIKGAFGRKADLHELPIERIGAVIVRRKNVVPFAAFTVLAAIATVLLRYNGAQRLKDGIAFYR